MGVPEAGLHGAADPEVEREADDVRAVLRGDLGRAVGRAVGDDDDVEARVECAQLVDDAADRLLLVERGDDRDPTHRLSRQRLLPQPEQCEQPARAVPVGVLVEHTLARAPAQLLGLRRVGEQLAIRVRRLLGVVDDDQLGARLEPALDAVVRVRDDRRARRCELERPARRRCVYRSRASGG